MMRRALALLLVPASFALAADCPWLNTATASGLLGGAAALHYDGASDAGSGVCEFTREAGKAMIDLRIEINAGHASRASLLSDPRLHDVRKKELRGIGNEAWSVPASGGGEWVIGRVRGTAFAIRARNSPDERAAEAAALKAAELVAGNLF
jgi:hypothetical protein